jgi:hypothetical protein
MIPACHAFRLVPARATRHRPRSEETIMRTFLALALLLSLVLLGRGSAGAADSDVAAIVDKALKAHGGAEKLALEPAMRTKGRGTINVGGGTDFTVESTVQSGKLRGVIQMSIAGQEVTLITVFDGMKAWQKVNGETKEQTGEILLYEARESAYVTRLRRLAFLKDKSLELSPLGEAKVNDRPAVGIKVVSKGHRDVNLYFDKESGLLAKTTRRMLDATTQQEISEEWIVQERQEVDGVKVPRKILLNHDGKKFMEAEIVEVKFLEKVAPDEFAEP